MKTELIEKCDLLENNRDILRSVYEWDSDIMMLSAASIYTALGVKADVMKMKACEDIIERNSSDFLAIRGNVKMPILCKMSLSADPEGYFNTLCRLYNELNTVPIIGNEYKIIAAMLLADAGIGEDNEGLLPRTNSIYQHVRREHKWLTSDEDIPYAAILAVCDEDPLTFLDEGEKAFLELKNKFLDLNALQNLCNFLGVCVRDDIAEKCRQLINVFDLLKKQRHRYGNSFMLSSLGLTILSGDSADDVAGDIIDADDYLRHKKGFSDIALGFYERRMYAAQVVGLTSLDAFLSGESLKKQETVLKACLTVVLMSAITMTSTTI